MNEKLSFADKAWIYTKIVVLYLTELALLFGMVYITVVIGSLAVILGAKDPIFTIAAVPGILLVFIGLNDTRLRVSTWLWKLCEFPKGT